MTLGTMLRAVVLMLVLVGCAKQPTTTVGSAPAPDGAPGGASMADAVRRASATPGDTVRGAGYGSGASGAAGADARPAVQDFRLAPGLSDIHFDYDRAEIREGDARILDANAAWLKTHRDHLVLIEGHCDERGTNEYNTALGDRRAKATMNYLVSRGVAASRIAVISYGEERPVCSESVAECWAKNRRAHFLVKPH